MSQGSFLESLKTYLSRLTEAASPERDAKVSAIDPTWARNLLLRTMERAESGEGDDGSDPVIRHLRAQRAPQTLEDWQTGDRIIAFVHELARLLSQGLAAGASKERQKHLIELGLARLFGLPGELPSRIQTSELDRLVREAKALAWQIPPAVSVGRDILRYADSNQLAIRKAGRTLVSPIGEVFLQLQGRDAVRWLLQVEAQLALGPLDPERLSREAAATILSKNSWLEHVEEDSDEGSDFPCAPATATRLLHLGLLTAIPEKEYPVTKWSVSSLGKELLGELVQPSKTAFALLAESLCSDLVSSAVQTVGGGNSQVLSSAAEATASQARMVAHEVRNALLPVQAALDSLYREVQVLPPSEVLRRRRPVIDKGLKGALRFTKDLLQTAELGAKPPELFEPVQATNEVISTLIGKSGVLISPPSASSLPLLLGRREHFMLAVRNLIENAIQHGGAKLKNVRVDMMLDAGETVINLDIHDDGQGVAEADRDRIFQEGVSNKPGGTGIGLSWVRQVVEQEMRGIVVCSRSPLGGAYFAIQLPIAVSGQPPRTKEPS